MRGTCVQLDQIDIVGRWRKLLDEQIAQLMDWYTVYSIWYEPYQFGRRKKCPKPQLSTTTSKLRPYLSILSKVLLVDVHTN